MLTVLVAGIAVVLTPASCPAARAGAQPSARPVLCDHGQRQSPIDIVSAERVALPDLEFDYRRAPARLVNDGHTVRVRFANGSRLRAGGERFVLQQFHFHLPAGDRVAGEAFPLGLHLTHKSVAGQLLALVVLFRPGAEHPGLAALLPHLPPPGRPELTLDTVQVDPMQWLPRQRGYYAFDGSLTGPPCTEGVRWLVMKRALTLSPAQLERLSALIPPNARPVQPLHGRRVFEHE